MWLNIWYYLFTLYHFELFFFYIDVALHLCVSLELSTEYTTVSYEEKLYTLTSKNGIYFGCPKITPVATVFVVCFIAQTIQVRPNKSYRAQLKNVLP